MALQIELLETSFQEIAPRGEAFVQAFYATLFTEFPQTKAFFSSTDMKEQQKKLLGALALVIQNLRKPDVLAAALQGLGQRHAGYGVRPEHYPIVGAVLLRKQPARDEHLALPDQPGDVEERAEAREPVGAAQRR